MHLPGIITLEDLLTPDRDGLLWWHIHIRFLRQTLNPYEGTVAHHKLLFKQ